MTDTELLLAHCRIIDHIRQRNLHSPGGNPIAGYAELLVSERLRLELAPDENVGFDARDLATGEDLSNQAHKGSPKSPTNWNDQQSRWQTVRLACIPDS